MEVMVEEITIVEVSGETFIKIALEETAFRVINLIYYYYYYYYSSSSSSYDKRNIIYMGNLDTS